MRDAEQGEWARRAEAAESELDTARDEIKTLRADVERLTRERNTALTRGFARNAEAFQRERAENIRLQRQILDAQDAAREAASKASRRRGGPAPFGYRRDADGKFVEDMDECNSLAMIQTMRLQGKSYATITRTMNERGRPSRGKRWYETTIVRLLARPEHWNPAHGPLSTCVTRAR
jgi:phage-related tail protein